jgi:microcompartment protein CcmK/EutM
MILCEVTGTLVSTRKNERFRTSKLLIVHPIDVEGMRIGTKDLLALDPKFDAGVGDRVMVAKEGAVVEQLMDAGPGGTAAGTPANVIIVAVVDDWDLGR